MEPDGIEKGWISTVRMTSARSSAWMITLIVSTHTARFLGFFSHARIALIFRKARPLHSDSVCHRQRLASPLDCPHGKAMATAAPR